MRCFRVGAVGCLLIAVVALLIACSQQPAQPVAPSPPAQPAAQPAPPAAAAPAGVVLGSERYNLDQNIRIDILEVKRVSGGAVRIKWSVTNTGTQNASYDFGWEQINFIDPAENKKYSFLTDSEGNRIMDVHWGSMKPGESWQNWAKFPEPPATSTKISISVGRHAPFEDIPISQ